MRQRAEPILFRSPQTYAPVTYVGCSKEVTGRAWGMRPHSHPFALEVSFVVNGCAEWWSNAGTFEAHPGDVWVIPPKDPHGAVDATQEPCQWYWVHIDARSLSDEVLDVLSLPGFSGLRRSAQKIGHYVLEIFEEHKRKDSFSARSCEALVDLMLAALVRDRTAKEDGYRSMLVRRAVKKMLEDSEETMSMGHIAEELGVSVVWLTHQFKQELGQPPAKWLRTQRLREARRLLATTDMTVADVGATVGFASSQYFATAFLRGTGMSPTEYRKQRDNFVISGH